MTGFPEPWRLVADPRAVACRLPSPPEVVRALPPGTPVVLVDARPGAGWRARRFAAAAGVRVEAAYLGLPSAGSPLYVVEDSAEALRYFWSDLLALPYRGPLLPLAQLAVAVLRRAGAWRWTALVAPGRILVGTRR